MYSSTPWSFATKVVFPEPTSPGQAHKLSQEHKDGSEALTACLILLMFYVLTKKSKMCLSRTLLSRQNLLNPSCCNAVTGFVAHLVQFKREIQFVVGSQKAIKTRDRGQQPEFQKHFQ